MYTCVFAFLFFLHPSKGEVHLALQPELRPGDDNDSDSNFEMCHYHQYSLIFISHSMILTDYR